MRHVGVVGRCTGNCQAGRPLLRRRRRDVRGGDDFVRQHIVDKRRAESPWVTQVLSLNWSWPIGENARSRIPSVAFEVDQNIDSVGKNLSRRGVIGKLGNVRKVLECRFQA